MGYDCEVCLDMCEQPESYSPGLTLCTECGREVVREDTMYCTCGDNTIDEWCGLHGYFSIHI